MSDQCSTSPGATHYAGCACHEQGWRNKWECAVEMAARGEARLEAVQSELDELKAKYAMHYEEAERLTDVIRAATVLIAAKGRHNTQLAYQGLRDAIAENIPTLPTSFSEFRRTKSLHAGRFVNP